MNTKPAQLSDNGFLYALGCYFLWGGLPLYFKILEKVPALEMLSHRILWSVPTGILLVFFAGKFDVIYAAFKNKKNLFWLTLSGILMGANWLIYIWAVQNGRVLEGSLGYFINPLFSFGLAAIFFGERFTKFQIIAILLAAAGVLNQALVVGQFPWVAISLCVTFGVYGAIRKKVQVDSRAGFLFEVIILLPIALAFLTYGWLNGRPFLATDPTDSILITLAGVVTAAPLIMFGLAAKRLRLSSLAMMQYIGPTIQFCVGIYLGEAFTPEHAITFGFIWLGVILFSFGALQNERRAKKLLATKPT
ncbi:EamA family transporter RarD [Hirschia baltica]|uniref:RarD protein, DMT superfamily transporter n=1 Tax=Hirschia baltica (strain ATCC 49814 / DSM 5838 / IFAM 1418) TaxID=582402 RepID=C6XLR0_HIRBI|nr:EamA family transporter RarD [Hirschia baltica]ACT57966.1 RarD protein, DMT superfamily transporter [Hirschia baltica ATCC 49814]